MPKTYSTFDEVCSLFAVNGVSTLYIKHLSKKQDNDKNQIYLGSTSMDGLANLLPSKIIPGRASESTLKRKSKKGRPKQVSKLNFYWILNDGSIELAPNTKIIDYFQYPEVRLSGFLSGSPNSPTSLRRKQQSIYGKRILLFGSNRHEQVFGMVLTELKDPVVKNFPRFEKSVLSGIIECVVIESKIFLETADLEESSAPNINYISKSNRSPRDLILSELSQIHKSGWLDSCILDKKTRLKKSYQANNGSGYTLEALLGVLPNASKRPDKYGYEIKTTSKNPVSLFTPTADGGAEGELPFKQFMTTYGWKAKRDIKRLVFTGNYKSASPKNMLILSLHGFDKISGDFDHDPENIYISLCRTKDNFPISKWSLSKLTASWEKKHSNAVYVPNERDAKRNKYRFSNKIYLCHGTSIWRMLRAVERGTVYYDPAHALYLRGHPQHPNGKSKVRPQFRISTAQSAFLRNLSELYKSVEEIDLNDL